MEPVLAVLTIFALFVLRFAIPVAVLVYLGVCQERNCGPAF